MFNSPFITEKKKTLDPETQIVFVADDFVGDYAGGAELTTEALIKSCPFTYEKVKARDVNIELLEAGHQKYWIFGNFSDVDTQLIPTIVANLNYSVLEYDYKYCRYRSPEKHLMAEQTECDCHEQLHGKMISAFYYGAKSLWWMSERQENKYTSMFPFLAEKESAVLSSVFDDEFFLNLKLFREQANGIDRSGWIVPGLRASKQQSIIVKVMNWIMKLSGTFHMMNC